jgi:CheY-like chemotaxis protein
VVVMSGMNRPHIRQRALDAGAEAFLPRPVDPERLLRQLMGVVPAPSSAPAEAPHDSAGETGRYAS